MFRILRACLVLVTTFVSCTIAFAQSKTVQLNTGSSGELMPQYAGRPNHRELARRALELAIAAGFSDTSITIQEIQSRIETGAYSEDYDLIPGVIGVHYPDPWAQGPEFDFGGWFPFSRIPYGSLTDNSSGWFRGLPHAYDPVQNFKWPGAEETTTEWANSISNSFTWDNARSLYSQGKKADAYECLGHLLHLLADLSVPQHVKIVGAEMLTRKSGTILNPDIAVLVVDEFQMALSGGLVVPGPIGIIPDLLGEFRYALTLADPLKIPRFSSWDGYFRDLAEYAYHQPLVEKYYAAPSVNGQFGRYKDEAGNFVSLHEYALTFPSPIGSRWTQISLRTTARIGIPPNVGPVIPEVELRSMCDDLVSKAAEYSAGFILHFMENVTVAVNGYNPGLPSTFGLSQNYPNPFNPVTLIQYRLPATSQVTLKICDILGRELVSLVDEVESSGYKSVQFDASGLSSGVYFYRLTASTLSRQAGPDRIGAGTFVDAKKLLLLR